MADDLTYSKKLYRQNDWDFDPTPDGNMSLEDAQKGLTLDNTRDFCTFIDGYLSGEKRDDAIQYLSALGEIDAKRFSLIARQLQFSPNYHASPDDQTISIGQKTVKVDVQGEPASTAELLDIAEAFYHLQEFHKQIDDPIAFEKFEKSFQSLGILLTPKIPETYDPLLRSPKVLYSVQALFDPNEHRLYVTRNSDVLRGQGRFEARSDDEHRALLTMLIGKVVLGSETELPFSYFDFLLHSPNLNDDFKAKLAQELFDFAFLDSKESVNKTAQDYLENQFFADHTVSDTVKTKFLEFMAEEIERFEDPEFKGELFDSYLALIDRAEIASLVTPKAIQLLNKNNSERSSEDQKKLLDWTLVQLNESNVTDDVKKSLIFSSVFLDEIDSKPIDEREKYLKSQIFGNQNLSDPVRAEGAFLLPLKYEYGQTKRQIVDRRENALLIMRLLMVDETVVLGPAKSILLHEIIKFGLESKDNSESREAFDFFVGKFFKEDPNVSSAS